MWVCAHRGSGQLHCPGRGASEPPHRDTDAGAGNRACEGRAPPHDSWGPESQTPRSMPAEPVRGDWRGGVQVPTQPGRLSACAGGDSIFGVCLDEVGTIACSPNFGEL